MAGRAPRVCLCHSLAAKLRPDAHLLRHLVDALLPLQVPEGASVLVTGGVQVVQVLARGIPSGAARAEGEHGQRRREQAVRTGPHKRT